MLSFVLVHVLRGRPHPAVEPLLEPYNSRATIEAGLGCGVGVWGDIARCRAADSVTAHLCVALW